MCTGGPDVMNAQGDKMSDEDKGKLAALTSPFLPHMISGAIAQDPAKRAEMLLNWLHGGPAPKKVDPSAIFKEKQDMAGIEAKGAAGQGINGLFGFGKMIGDLTPAVTAPAPVEAVKPIKMIEPMNQSPMQPGVPYSAIPVPGGK